MGLFEKKARQWEVTCLKMSIDSLRDQVRDISRDLWMLREFLDVEEAPQPSRRLQKRARKAGK